MEKNENPHKYFVRFLTKFSWRRQPATLENYKLKYRSKT